MPQETETGTQRLIRIRAWQKRMADRKALAVALVGGDINIDGVIRDMGFLIGCLDAQAETISKLQMEVDVVVREADELERQLDE